MRRACCEDHEYPEVVLALIPDMKKETAETYLGEKADDTLVMGPAYNDSNCGPVLKHGKRHLQRALLTIEEGVFGYEPLQETRTLEQTHERYGLVWLSTSSFDNPLAEHSCVYESEYGRCSGVTVEGVQSEISSYIQRAQLMWIAPDCCTWPKVSSPIPGQDHLPKPLRSAEDWSGTSSCSSGKQQTQGSEPLLVAEAKLAVGTQ